ncbi:MAG: prefoldin subunit alpha [Promethearchaeota archaeon]
MNNIVQSDRERLNILLTTSKEYESQAEQIQIQIDYLNQSIAATQIEGETIESLKNLQNGQEILLPLGNLTFIKAKLLDSSKVLINVGASVVLEKSIDHAKEQLDQHLENLSKSQMQLRQALQQIMQEIQKIRSEVEKLAVKMQQPQKQKLAMGS